MDLAVEGDMHQARRQSGPIPARLGLLDAVSIIVGIIIGVGIFETPPKIFAMAPGPWWAMALWLAGGLLALVGAFCFAELATAYPRSGGEYVYLTRAYGPSTGFLFAWAQLTLIRPGSIGALAFVFAKYAGELWSLTPAGQIIMASLAVLGLTSINILGVTLGKHTQNLLTVLKIVGLAVIVIIGFAFGRLEEPPVSAGHDKPVLFATAMIFILWSYAGWHEAAYIATEVKDNRRNLPLALILGTLGVTAIYLMVNAAFLLGLGYTGAQSPQAITKVVDLLAEELPLGMGAQGLNILIMVSALGAINGMVFTTARIYSEFGVDHRLFASLSHWSRRLGTPVRALAVQALITLVFMVGVWLWDQGKESLEKIIEVTAAVFWLFFLMTGIALFVLRAKDPDQPRPFRVPVYPWLPASFCLMCASMIVGAIVEKPAESLVGMGLLALGIPLFFLPKKWKKISQAEQLPEPTPEPVGQPCANP